MLAALIKNGNNSLLVPFPCKDDVLQDHLSSIGITEPAQKVYLGSDVYDIELKSSGEEVSKMLVSLFTKNNSIKMVNEVAKAVFRSDFRVFDRVKGNLEQGRYKTPDDVLYDAHGYAKDLKIKNKDHEKKNRDYER